MSGNFIGLAGIVVILGLAVLVSGNRKAINLRIVGAAFALQVAVAVFVLYSRIGVATIETMSVGVQNVINYSRAGIDMVFGGLAAEPVGFSFAVDNIELGVKGAGG